MAKESERVYVMKKNFMTLHNEGYSILKIAKIYHLSVVTVYRHLQEIADENNCLRNELLKIVKTRPLEYVRDETSYFKVTIKEIHDSLEMAKRSVQKLQSKIKKVLDGEMQNENY